MAKKLKRKEADGAPRAQELWREPGAVNKRFLDAILSISGCATLDEALEPLLKAALAVTKMDGGGVYRVEDGVAVLRHHRGLPKAFVREVTRVPLTRPPVPSVLDQCEPVEVAEISSVMREVLRRHGIQHAFSFPLRARRILFGFLNVGSTRAEAPKKADIHALWVLVREIESLFFRLYSEQALRESEERQRRLLENLKGSHFIYVHDTQGVFQYLSESVTDILGYTPEEFMAHYSRYMTDHPVNQEVHRHTELSIQGIRQPPYEVNLWHKDGSSRWLEVQEVPVFDATGRVIAVEGVAQDITERKRAEEALRKSEQLLRRSQEIAHLGSWELDLTTNELTWSDEVYRILGLEPQEFTATYEAFLERMHPDDRQAVDDAYTSSVREGRDTFEIEHRIVRKDTGEVRIVHEKCEHFRAADGRIVRSTGMVHDITERKRAAEILQESEERFNAFMDNSPAIAWMRDEQGRYVYLSRTYTRNSGKTLEESRGKTAFDIWPREIAEGFWRLDQEVLRTGRPTEVMEEIPTPDGGRSYWWNVKFPFQDASGRRFVGGIGVDITERKRMEAMLQQTNERLEEQVQARTEELNHTIDQLQSAMGELEQHAGQLQKLTLDVVQAEDRERRRLAEFLHDDLQQSLAAAKFHLSMLDSHLGSDSLALEILGQIKQMLKDAIEKSRSLSHELGPPVLYHNQLDAVFEWLAGQMESKHGLAVRVEIRGGADSDSEPVRSFLYRTAQELLFNVAKHAHVQEATLRLQRVRDELWLTISDKGRGFDLTSLGDTTGFGLATIRERAKLLGGRMIIKSAPGKGSIFFVAVSDAGA